ncbi:MAG: hypothetical protein GY854_32845 [Deltaproteobacteria bacterium]|nr:hypothetical protein [Deltaproteobacteria bacterium]
MRGILGILCLTLIATACSDIIAAHKYYLCDCENCEDCIDSGNIIDPYKYNNCDCENCEDGIDSDKDAGGDEEPFRVDVNKK